jgi:hypothetical protein
MIGGFLIPISSDLKKFEFVFASLGDCKAYRYSHASNTVSDLTTGNRVNINDVSPSFFSKKKLYVVNYISFLCR